MASQKFERAVYLVSTSIRMHPEDAPKDTIPAAIALLKRLYDQQRAFAGLNDTDGIDDTTIGLTPDEAQKANHELGDVIYIADWVADADQTTLLITRGDNDISSPAVVNRKDRAVRVEKPRDDESPGHSCHIVISHAADPKTGAHRVAIERVPNVSRTLVTRFLNSLIRTESKKANTTFERKTGKAGPHQVACYPSIDFAHHPSQNLEQDVKDGRVTSITLIARNEEFAGVDAGVRIKRAKRDLSLSVEYQRDSGKFMDWLKGWVAKYARDQKYEEVQIHLSGLDGAGRSASPTFALEKVESSQTVYARTAILTDFHKPLEQCESECNKEVMDKMKVVVGDDNQWKA